jgi:hypothetical protein
MEQITIDRDDFERLVGFVCNAAGMVTYLAGNWQNTHPALLNTQLQLSDEHLRGAVNILDAVYVTQITSPSEGERI